MKPHIKRAWINALRSGKYIQGYGALKSISNEFCCLGVLCDVIDPTRWHDCSYNFPNGESRKNLIPLYVNIAIGLYPELQNVLIKMNDKQRNSFGEISDYIEENVK